MVLQTFSGKEGEEVATATTLADSQPYTNPWVGSVGGKGSSPGGRKSRTRLKAVGLIASCCRHCGAWSELPASYVMSLPIPSSLRAGGKKGEMEERYSVWGGPFFSWEEWGRPE